MEAVTVNTLAKNKGFTLIEIMITLAVAVILASTTAPSLITMIQNNRMVSLHNNLLGDLALARSTAVTRGNYATLCASNASGDQCLVNTINWKYGWLVFDDVNNDGSVDPNEAVLLSKNTMIEQLKLIGNTTRISFDAEGSAFGFSGEFAFCDNRGEEGKKGLIVSNSGRSRVAESYEIMTNCP